MEKNKRADAVWGKVKDRSGALGGDPSVEAGLLSQHCRHSKDKKIKVIPELGEQRKIDKVNAIPALYEILTEPRSRLI